MAELGSHPICTSNGDSKSPPSPLLDRLSDELLVEILKRLPLKPANRCKCVSKRWLNSISSPYFARCYANHRSSLAPDSALFFQYSNTPNRRRLPEDVMKLQLAPVENLIFNSSGFSLNFLSPPPSSSDPEEPVISVLASSNGLVLCSATAFFQRLYYVCNPLTTRWIALPPPLTCHRKVSVGFVSNSDRIGELKSFRVVRIPEFEKVDRLYNTIELEVFSSETGQWTGSVFSSHESVFSSCFIPRDSAVVCNGILYWRVLHLKGIFTFDPYKTDKYQILGYPEYRCNLDKGKMVHLLGECQDHLRYGLVDDDGIFRIWDYCSSSEWCLVHMFHNREIVVEENTNFPKFVSRYPELLRLVAFHPVDEDVMFLSFPGRILELNLPSRSLKRVCCLALGHHPKFFPFLLPWWPTLVPQL